MITFMVLRRLAIETWFNKQVTNVWSDISGTECDKT